MFNNTCSIFTHITSNFVYVIGYCLLVIFIIANLILASVVKLPKRNIAIYLILFFLLIILAILGGVLICYVRRKDPSIQPKIKILTIISLIFTILLLVFAIVEEVIVSIDYSKIQKSDCFIDDIKPKAAPVSVAIKKSDKNLKINSDIKRILANEDNITGCINSYLLNSSKNYSYFALTLIEIVSIISIIYWYQNKKKHADQPIQPPAQNIPNIQQVVINPNPIQISSVYISSGQQILPTNYTLHQNVLYTYNQIPYNNNAILYNNANLNFNKGNLNNNNFSGQQNIQNNNNYQVQQNVQNNNNNIQSNNEIIFNDPNHVINENINNNENSSDRKIYN